MFGKDENGSGKDEKASYTAGTAPVWLPELDEPLTVGINAI